MAAAIPARIPRDATHKYPKIENPYDADHFFGSSSGKKSVINRNHHLGGHHFTIPVIQVKFMSHTCFFTCPNFLGRKIKKGLRC